MVDVSGANGSAILEDRIPVMISERLIDVTQDYRGGVHTGDGAVSFLQPA